MHDNADSVKLSVESSPALVEQAAQAGHDLILVRVGMQERGWQPCCTCGWEGTKLLFGSEAAVEGAAHLLAVVAPLLRAEGAADEREAAWKRVEAVCDEMWGEGWAIGTRDKLRAAVLALVSREAEASE